MKKLLVIILFSIVSCTISEPKSKSYLIFPEEWRGYYDKYMGASLWGETSFKISKSYITFKKTYTYDGDNPYMTFQIKRIYQDARYPNDLIVKLESAYENMGSDFESYDGEEEFLRNEVFRFHRKNGMVYLYNSYFFSSSEINPTELAVYRQVQPF